MTLATNILIVKTKEKLLTFFWKREKLIAEI